MSEFISITQDNTSNSPYNYDTSNQKKEDDTYLLFLLQPTSRLIKKLVDDLLDRLEYDGSIIYHEYPDKNELLRILQPIYATDSFPDNSTELTEAIFFYEIFNRRRRYFNIVNNYQ